MLNDRIVITGIGLTAPNGNTLAEFRKNLVEGVARIQMVDMRYIGPVAAGVCDYDARKYQTRKEIMQSIRGKGNKTTELKLLSLFKENKVTGWRRHQPLPGKPDFAFPMEKVAVFVDGCFWHGCPRHFVQPRSNKNFWKEKINKNKKRDKEVSRKLKQQGWKVVRIWEHELRKPEEKTISKIQKKIISTKRTLQ